MENKNIEGQATEGKQSEGMGTNANAVKTFTQEELNKVVQERLARQSEKFADYEALKDKSGCPGFDPPPMVYQV